jgi:hypothetical protein
MDNQPDTDATDDGAEGQDNDLIKSLRDQLKAAKTDAKTAQEAAETAKAEARGEFQREQAAQQLVDAAGYPGMTEVVLAKVDGEVTAEAVLESLQALSLNVDVEAMQANIDGQPKPEGATTKPVAQDVADTANLGARVSAAAQGQDVDGTDAKLAGIEAVSADDAIAQVTAIAQEAGFYDPS